jgi:hypothetical protein
MLPSNDLQRERDTGYSPALQGTVKDKDDIVWVQKSKVAP